MSIVKVTSNNNLLHFGLKWTSLKELSWQDSLLESLQFEKFRVSSFWIYSNAFTFKTPAPGTYFQNTCFLPASAKLAVKYRPGQWNTGHLAALTCRDPISLIVGTRFSLILGTRWSLSLILWTRFSILGTRICVFLYRVSLNEKNARKLTSKALPQKFVNSLSVFHCTQARRQDFATRGQRPKGGGHIFK